MRKFTAAAVTLGFVGGLVGAPSAASASTGQRALDLTGPVVCVQLSMPPRVCGQAT